MCVRYSNQYVRLKRFLAWGAEVTFQVASIKCMFTSSFPAASGAWGAKITSFLVPPGAEISSHSCDSSQVHHIHKNHNLACIFRYCRLVKSDPRFTINTYLVTTWGETSSNRAGTWLFEWVQLRDWMESSKSKPKPPEKWTNPTVYACVEMENSLLLSLFGYLFPLFSFSLVSNFFFQATTFLGKTCKNKSMGLLARECLSAKKTRKSGKHCPKPCRISHPAAKEGR